MPTYNKLVRDRIPEIIATDGKSCTVKSLSDEEYATELRTKLGEELHEYFNTTNDLDAVEELADIMELIHALSKVHGSSPENLERVRHAKAENRGGFKDKVFLVKVED